MKKFKKYIPSTLIFGAIGWFAIQGLEIDFSKKPPLPEPYVNMTEAALPKMQQELIDEAAAISEQREKMTDIMLNLPQDRSKLTDNFFTSRGTTKQEFLAYYEMSERQLYKK